MMGHYRLIPAVIQRPLSQFASCQRGEDAGQAENGEDTEGNVHAVDEGRVIFRCNLHVADVNTEYQHYHTHAEGHSYLSHGG